MSEPGWRTSRAVLGRDRESGHEVRVLVGLVETPAGGVQVALRVGEDRTVILALQDANQLGRNVHEVTAERLTVTVEILGGEES